MKLNTRQFSVLLLTAFPFIPSVFADYALPRSDLPICAYLSKQIFCYGGYIPATTNSFISLNISSFTEEVSADYLDSQWANIISAAGNIDVANRYEAQGIALPDGVSFIIQGGYSNETTLLSTQTIVYNSVNNTWTEWPDFTETVSGNTTTRQIYGATAVYLPSSNSVAYYGGNQQHVYPGYVYNSPQNNYTISQITRTDPHIPSETLSDVGFFYITLLNLGTQVWSSMIQATNNQLVFAQTATFHPRSGIIYYIGGVFRPTNANTTSWSLLPLSTAQYFDTAEGTWGNQSISNTGNLSPRIYHTANLLPSGDDILIYGGSNYPNTAAVSDYCISFNVNKMAWTSYSLTAPGNFSGERYQHAAVLVDNALFVMFGIDKYGNDINDLGILDISNPTNVAFMPNYAFGNLPDTTTTLSGNGGLSTGAKAGIAVGCVLAAALIAIALYFFCCKKRSSKSSRYQQYLHENKSQSIEDGRQDEMLEVNWDQVDRHYSKDQQPANANPLQSSAVNSEHFNGDKSPTMVLPTNTNNALLTTDHLDESTKVTPNISGDVITPNIASEANFPSKPHALQSFVTPDVGMPRVEKPEVLPVKPDALQN